MKRENHILYAFRHLWGAASKRKLMMIFFFFHQVQQGQKPNQKPMKDPNAPKKPLSAYFLFSQEERLKVKAEFPDYSITEVAKELGRRWATIDPAVKQSYEQRYQVGELISCVATLPLSALR